MVSYSSVKSQLSQAGFSFGAWGKAEVKELCNIVTEDETILYATNGYYEGGFAMLVGTDQRILLVDKKPMYLSLDTITYGMIQEVTLNYRLLNSTINIYTSNKCLSFRSWNHHALRELLTYSQQRVIESRQLQQMGSYQGFGYAGQNIQPQNQTIVRRPLFSTNIQNSIQPMQQPTMQRYNQRDLSDLVNVDLIEANREEGLQVNSVDTSPSPSFSASAPVVGSVALSSGATKPTIIQHNYSKRYI